MDIRQTINSRLKELGWTKYKLAKSMHPHLTRQSVYQYLGGRGSTSVSNLQRMLDLLGLVVVASIVEKPCGTPPVAKKTPVKPKRRGGRVRD